MVLAGLAIDILLQTGKRTKRLDAPALQIILPFGDIAGIVGDRVGYIVTGHRCDRKNGDRTGICKVNCLFIAGCQLGIQVARITAVGRHLLLRNSDLLHGVGKVGHIGQKHQHIFILQRKLLGHCQGHIRDHHTFYRRIGRGVDEHNRSAQRAALGKRILKIEEVVIFEAHTAQHDDIRLCLHGNAGEQLVVGLS